LPADRAVSSARLFVAADDRFEVRLNGDALGRGADWRTGSRFDALGGRLQPGTNLLAVVAENMPANVPANPAGLLARLEVRLADATVIDIVSDAAWRCAAREAPGWDRATFDDTRWTAATTTARYGGGPWGRIGGGMEFDEPQAAGIPGAVRIVWVPRAARIRLRQLDPQAAWVAAHFDPVSGLRRELGRVQADTTGDYRCAPPAGIDHDWVLVLEAR
jgi:hypothetical protein